MGPRGAYGRLGAFGSEDSGDWLTPLSTIAAGVYAESQDPVRQVAILTAQLQNAYARGAPLSEITLLKAKLTAAQAALAAAQATDTSRWEWTNLGKLASVVTIVLGVVVIYRVAQ